MARDSLFRGRGRILVSAPLLVLAALALVVATWSAAHALDADTNAQPLAAQPCGRSTAAPVHYKHVIWIWMENHSYGQVIGSDDAPFENSIAHACGLATDYRAVAHPSLPNYLAAVGGGTFGVTADQYPSATPIKAPTVFSEVTRSGRQWRTYRESMSTNCEPLGGAGYARNPPPYFAGSRQLCGRWDVPMGTVRRGSLATALTNDRLPAFSLMIPNLCHSTHACPVATGDIWLSQWINRIVTSASYRNGSTAIFLTWDEGKHDLNQHVPMIVISPTTTPGATSGTAFNHYSLLRTTAGLLGITPPGHAAGAVSMQKPFGL